MSFELKGPLPYCPGCGHQLIVNGTAKAFDKLGWEPEDVVLITDIGCVGLADKYFPCHTIHGLHGRAVALGTGIRFGLNNPDKQVLVYQGDGGATIGLQHLMEAARLNVNLKVVIHNNMLYGMTGGQSSGLTPPSYKTTTEPEGSTSASYDLPQLAHQAGAAFTSRILGKGDISEDLAEAFSSPGFSLVEVMEYCVSYGTKHNPGEKLEDTLQKMGRSTGKWMNKDRVQYEPQVEEDKPNLLDQLPEIQPSHDHYLTGSLSLILGGSAGEGVQTAATVLAQAGMLAGLDASKKGEYPITVGSGFSTAQVILSSKPIMFTGIVNPEVVIITSEDGLNRNKQEIGDLVDGTLLIDKSLLPPPTGAQVLSKAFREKAGPKGATLCAVAFWLQRCRIIPWEKLTEAAKMSKHSDALTKAVRTGFRI